MVTGSYVLSPDMREHAVGEWSAVYNRHWGGLCFMDSAAKQFMDLFSLPQVVQGDGPEQGGLFVAPSSPEETLLRQLALRRVLVPASADAGALASAPAQPPVQASRINVVQLVLVNACNFGCSYCFEGVQGADLNKQPPTLLKLRRGADSEPAPEQSPVNLQNSVYASEARLQHQRDPQNRLMKPRDAVEYVRKAIAVARQSGTKRLMLQFFGGEPMLNWRAIVEVLHTFGRGESNDVEIDYSIVTNGSLIDEEMARTFHEYQVGVCVSFDSPESTSRPLKNGSDSRPLVLRALQLLQAAEVRVAMNVALSTDTWSSVGPSLVDFALQYDIREIGVVVDLDPAFYSRFGSTAITEKVWSLVSAGQEHGVVITGYWHQIFQLMGAFGAISSRGFKNCSATGAQLSIEPNGSVFSCKAGSGQFGSIHDADLLTSAGYRAHAALRQNNPSFCRGCEIEGFCAGLCLGPREKTYGSIERMEPAACGFYREITHKFIEAQQPYSIATFELSAARQRFHGSIGTDRSVGTD